MATGMHHPLTGRGVGQPGPLFDRQGIHVHPQSNGGTVLGSQLRKDAGPSDSLLHPPAKPPQISSHQSGGLMLFTTELRMGVEMTTQLQQLREMLLEAIAQGQRGGRCHLKEAARRGKPSDRWWAAGANGVDQPASLAIARIQAGHRRQWLSASPRT